MQDNLIGATLGQYQIVSLIGRGGMAAVYKAFQPTLERYVAVKVLPAYFAHDPDFAARFRREARAIAQLEHPNILPVHDFGDFEGTPYLVMPLVGGGTLKERLGAPLALDFVIKICGQVAQALDYAHSKGIIHRDVKPTNILLTPGDWAMLADFGIAKMVGSSAVLTRSGVGIGTPEYMSPEQSHGLEVDGRTDLYALAIMFHEMVVGGTPYKADTPLAVVLKHINDPVPSLRASLPSIPPQIDEIVSRALAKRPEDRQASPGAFIEELQRALQLAPTHPTPPEIDLDDAYAQITQAMDAADWQAAVNRCVQVLSVDPMYRDVDQLLGESRRQLRQIRDRETEIGALLASAQAAMDGGEFAEATSVLDRLLGIDPGHTEAHALHIAALRRSEVAQHLDSARAQLRANRFQQAIQEAEKALTLEPNEPEAGRILETARAQLEGQNAQRTQPNQLERARGMVQSRNYTAAIRILKELAAKGEPGAAELLGQAEQAHLAVARPGDNASVENLRATVERRAVERERARHRGRMPVVPLAIGGAIVLLVGGILASRAFVTPSASEPTPRALIVVASPTAEPTALPTASPTVAPTPLAAQCEDAAATTRAADSAMESGELAAAREMTRSLGDCPGTDMGWLATRLSGIDMLTQARAARDSGDWEVGIGLTRFLTAQDPALPGLTGELARTLVGAGRAALAGGDWVRAASLCSEGLALVETDAEADVCVAEAVPPTPTSAPQPISTARPVAPTPARPTIQPTPRPAPPVQGPPPTATLRPPVEPARPPPTATLRPPV